MDISREKRNKLNALSKEVFGVSSRWQKLLEDGNVQLLTRKVTEVVPGKDGEEPTTKEVEIPVVTEYGAKQFVTKRYTLQEVEDLLISFKKQLDDYKANMKKQQEEQAKKKAEEISLKQVRAAAEGSAAL